jgi:hypothetical protein
MDVAPEVIMDCRGMLRLLPLLTCALFTTSCMGDAKSWFRDYFGPAPKPRPIEELLEPDVDIASRDLLYGVGGRALAPRTDVTYRLLEKETGGSSINYHVEDPSGRRWNAKIGVEAKPEVAASRLLWAVGFRQPAVYHVTQWKIEGGPDGGLMPDARFRYEDPRWKHSGIWSWRENPFIGTPEFRGLVVMNILIENWDLKASNNKRYKLEGMTPRRVYVVKDLGVSFGHSVHIFFGSPSGDPEDFAKERFIEAVHGVEVEFGFRPLILNAGITDGLRVDDVLWACHRLAQLSDGQLRDAFRAAGYGDAEVAAFVDVLKRRIAEGLALEHRAGP